MRKLLLLSILVVLLGCESREACLPIENLSGSSVAQLEKSIALSQVKEGKKIAFVLVNNPYCFTEEDRMAIFMDDACVFSGQFWRDGVLEIPGELLERGESHVVLYFIRGDTVYEYSNKSLTPLGPEDKYLYVCFFDSDDFSRRVYFFPTRENCIQV